MNLKIHNGFTQIDDDLAPILSFFQWHKTAHGYVASTIKKKSVLMHRFVMGAKGEDIVDHINGDKTDNRRANLRFVTKAQNAQKAKRGMSTTGLMGVSIDQGYYRAYIRVNGSRRHLGMFKDPVHAAICYDFFAVKHYGPLAKTNRQLLAETLQRLDPDGAEARDVLQNQSAKGLGKNPKPVGGKNSAGDDSGDA